jgi:alpha-glucosidase
VGIPPDDLHFKSFYTKHCDALGIPIISSEEVEDRALQQAYYIINNMLAPIPDVRQQLVSRGYYVAIIGLTEQLTDLPEYRHMNSVYWNQRAKALGGSKKIKITSAAEENMVCFRRDRYYQENILIHEFAHTIHLAGLGEDYNIFDQELLNLYRSALDQGLWENTYAAENHQEYWAEGLQTYFNANIGINPGDGVHNTINTRDELKKYDLDLYKFINDFYDGFEWIPTCPKP